MEGAGVGDVHFAVVGAEAETVALDKTVGDAPDLACGGLITVDLEWWDEGLAKVSDLWVGA